MTAEQAVVPRNRRPKGQHTKPRDPDSRERATTKLPEYLEAHQVEALIRASPNPRAALTSALEFGDVGQGDRLIRASRATADRWIKAAAAKARELGVIPPGRRVSNHTLRHSYARHLLAHGRPIN